MTKLTWTRRMMIASGVAVASLCAVPAVAGAAGTSCYTGCTAPTVSASTVPPPSTSGTGTNQASASVEGSSSLPFTGADVGELAAVGAGAIVVGGVLARRRRSAS